jgi:hypothetical protein
MRTEAIPTRILGTLVQLACIGYLVVFLWVAALRLVYPFEVEWMEGGMLTHAARLLSDKPIYAAPSADFVPFFYTPLYPTLLAGLSHLTGGLSFALGRGVSLAFTLYTLGLLFYIGRREAGVRAGLIAAGLYAAMFRFTGAFYDVARPDAMFIALVLSACAVAYYDRTWRGVCLSAGLFVLGHFTKQTTSVFVPMVGLWLLFRHPRQAVVFGALVGALAVIGTILYDRATGGWFWTYVFEGHQGHLFYWKNILMEYWRDVLFLAPILLLLPLLWFSHRIPVLILSVFLVVHWAYAFWFRATTLDYVPHMYYQELWYESPRWALLVVPLAIAGLLAVHRWRQSVPSPRALSVDVFFLLCYVAGTGSSGLNHSTQWAYANCFMPIAVFGALFLALIAHDLSRAAPRGAVLVEAALIVQLVAFAYDPRAQVPDDADYAALDELNDALDAHPGTLFAPAHPFLAWQRDGRVHVHQMGIQDVAFMGGVQDLERRLAAHEWGVVLLEEQNRIPGLERHYRQARRFQWRTPDALRAKTGFLVRPQSLWVPKTAAPR